MRAGEIAQKLAQDAESICRRLLPNGKREGKEWRAGDVHGSEGKSLGVNLNTGVWKDFADDAMGGDLLDLWAATENLNMADAIQAAKNYLGITDTQFHGERPKQYTKPDKPRCEAPKNEVLKWLTDIRCLRLESIQAYKLAASGASVLFPSLRNGELIRWKKRDMDDKHKCQTSSDSEPCLFGWQAIPDDARSVVICEGELDAVSWWQLDKPALSVPNGAQGHNWIENEYDHLERFDKIYLSMDNDDAGKKAVTEIVDRLGRERVRVIQIPDPWKDANDLLKSHFDALKVKPLFDRARTLDPSELKPAADFVDEVIEGFYPPEGVTPGFDTPWDKVNGRLRFRPGEVSLLAGTNGHGKSELAGHLTLDAIWQDEKACIASMEFKPRRWLERLTLQAACVSKPSIPFIRAIHNWYQNKLWVFDAIGTARANRILEVFAYARRRYGIRLFVIDNLAKCGFAEDDYNGQKDFVDQLTDFAKEHDVHVTLVVHMRKGQNEDHPAGKMDIKGSGAITDMVDTVLVIWRNKPKEKERRKAEHERAQFDEGAKPDAMLICEKQRNGDDEPRIALWFDRKSHQFLGSSKDRPRRYVEFVVVPVEKTA